MSNERSPGVGVPGLLTDARCRQDGIDIAHRIDALLMP
jgi:hypothetical protein